MSVLTSLHFLIQLVDVLLDTYLTAGVNIGVIATFTTFVAAERSARNLGVDGVVDVGCAWDRHGQHGQIVGRRVLIRR